MEEQEQIINLVQPNHAYAWTTISMITPISNGITHVKLKFFKQIPFLAGQYLKLHLKEEAIYRAYSIASNEYSDNSELDLYIKYVNSTTPSGIILNKILENQEILASLPYGSAYYLEAYTTLFIIISGTGYGYGKSILLQALKSIYNRKIVFIWVTKTSNFFDEEWINFQINSNLEVYKIVEDDFESFKTTKETIAIHESKLSNSHFYLSGHPSMVKYIKNFLLQIGTPQHCIFGDLIN